MAKLTPAAIIEALAGFDAAELREIAKAVDQTYSGQIEARREELQKELQALQQPLFPSMSLPSQAAPAKAKKGQKAASPAVKYRDPNNAANVWSGRGRPARWVADYEKAGRKKEEFLV